MPPLFKQSGCCAVIVTALVVYGSGTAACATTLEEYRSLIVECRQEIEKNKVSEPRLRQLRSRLSAIKTVTYPGGGSVAVNTRPLLSALRQRSDGDPTKERFATLEALLTPADNTAIRNGDPRAQAAQVLAAKEFAGLRKPVEPDKSVVPSWWVRFTKWLKETAERFAEWLNNLIRDRRGASSPNLSGVRAFVKFLQFLLYFVLGVAALVAVYLLARSAAVRGWFAALRKRRKRSGDSGLDLDLSGDGIADPLGEARNLAAKGAYRDAIRMAYIASLRRLRENGLLVLEPNKTNWEYQRDLRRRSRDAAEALLPATRLFDRVWYGRRPGTPEEFAEAVQVHDAIGAIPDAPPLEPEETATAAGEGGTA